ncbi:MAG: PEP/pyruvate-binding domain-containing protein [Luteolibacter sp.]|uniref:PEP/pyruvate-binding domain-containing protein n=1 Tax=Luteolibacter sp. TaxID=1962973 RepID=UPI0032637E39
MPFLHPDTTDHSRLGGKGAALARLGQLGFDIPEWFAVPSDAAWTREELPRAVDALGTGPFAVRSSGATEDGAGHSFAGQFTSYLDVPAADVARRIADVRGSAKSDAALTYCREHGLPAPEKPAVLVQRMIDARCAGVAFSADPVSGRRGVIVLSAVAGTGEKLVSGEVDGETWRIDRNDEIEVQPDEAQLSAIEALEIAALARRCEVACSRPQDIEWAIDRSGKLWLLQSRPITTLALTCDPGDTLRVWDNSNIAESYGGVTTPLTFSFARRIYESAYREFCKLMSVPHDRIERSDDVFPQMLGLIRGRVYYNLVSWYRVLALLPGFQLNRGFMEQMMGVREPLPDEIVRTIVAENKGSRFADGLALVLTGFGLIRQLTGLRKQIARFQIRLDTALAAPPVPIPRMSGEELVAHYRDLERQLLKKWDAPLVNDFFAMIFYGVLRSLCVKWLGDSSGTLQNELLFDGGDIISAEPPRRIVKMAALAAAHPELSEILANPEIDPRKKLAALAHAPELAAEFEKYLTDFGDRCLEELKLESPTVRDDPASLLLSIGAMAGRPVAASVIPTEITKDHTRQLGPFKRFIFRYVLRQTRERVCSRENLRFERTRLFGRVRAILRTLGQRLAADSLLADAADVFYLEIGEVLAVWEATGTTADLGSLAKQRRAEFTGYEATEAPPDRFETRGPASRYDRFENTRPPVTTESSLIGTGACPGRVTGRVRVVIDPRGARLEPGEILVARQTDPGWVVLFPTAAGLLVERGSLLSHSAIVSRELRLPCIVSLPGITSTLKTGDLIEMDGAAGTVRILEP